MRVRGMKPYPLLAPFRTSIRDYESFTNMGKYNPYSYWRNTSCWTTTNWDNQFHLNNNSLPRINEGGVKL